MNSKYNILLLFVFLILFSCTTKEEKVKEYVEQNVVSQAENYLICQAIIKYVESDAHKVFTNRINYYAENPYYDFTYYEKELSRLYIGFASASCAIMKLFDERWNEIGNLYVMLSNEGNIEYQMHQIDSTLTFQDLIKETSLYSTEEIADIYFKPDHLKFTEITPELYRSIYRSMLCLGAKAYKYDIVDDIRIKEKEENKWTVDLVYHSGYCMPLEIGYDKENGFFVSEAPWQPETGESTYCINIENYAEKLTFEEGIKLLYLANGITETPEKYKNYEESIKKKYEVRESEYIFRRIDNYRLFLSDDAECNQGEESLKSFICKILSSKSFLKSRISLNKKELEWLDINNIPSFRFNLDLELDYRGPEIVGYDGSGASWEELKDNSAYYAVWGAMETIEIYVFTRVDGKWYLTEYWNREKDEDCPI